MMPISEEFALNQIDVEFCLADGTKEYLQTRLVEFHQAKMVYTNAIASGKTAVLSTVED
jgi:hypothetical protein